MKESLNFKNKKENEPEWEEKIVDEGGGEQRITRKRDNEGRVIEEVTEFISNNPVRENYKIKKEILYDDAGNIAYEQYEQPRIELDDTMVYGIEYDYNEQNLPAEKTIYSGRNVTKVMYEYDENGNCKHERKFENNELSKEVFRQFDADNRVVEDHVFDKTIDDNAGWFYDYMYEDGNLQTETRGPLTPSGEKTPHFQHQYEYTDVSEGLRTKISNVELDDSGEVKKIISVRTEVTDSKGRLVRSEFQGYEDGQPSGLPRKTRYERRK